MLSINERNEGSSIRDRGRVRRLGEVFTPRGLIEEMLDLIPDRGYLAKLDTRCLDPACGDGRFLEAILQRKLKILNRSRKAEADYDYGCLVALAHVHGIDLDLFNVEEARQRQMRTLEKYYRGEGLNSVCDAAVAILDDVIIQGDFLELDFTVVEWVNVGGGEFVRNVYEGRDLFPDEGQSCNPSDDLFASCHPSPAKEFPAIHWRELIR